MFLGWGGVGWTVRYKNIVREHNNYPCPIIKENGNVIETLRTKESVASALCFPITSSSN